MTSNISTQGALPSHVRTNSFPVSFLQRQKWRRRSFKGTGSCTFDPCRALYKGGPCLFLQNFQALGIHEARTHDGAVFNGRSFFAVSSHRTRRHSSSQKVPRFSCCPKAAWSKTKFSVWERTAACTAPGW